MIIRNTNVICLAAGQCSTCTLERSCGDSSWNMYSISWFWWSLEIYWRREGL